MRRTLILGYGVQFSSMALLAAANIVTPAVIGLDRFGAFSTSMGMAVLMTALVHDGLTWRTIAAVNSAADAGLVVELKSLLTQAVVSAVPLAITVGAVLTLVGKTFSGKELVAAFLTACCLAAYTAATAILPATGRNKVLLVLSVINGGMYIAAPVALSSAAHGQYVFVAPLVVYGVSLACVVAYLAATGTTWTGGMRVRKDGSLLPWSAPAAFKATIAWMPAVLLGVQRDFDAAGAYKVAVSVVNAATAAIPLHKPTLLSLAGRRTEGAGLLRYAVVLAACTALVATVLLYWATRVLVAYVPHATVPHIASTVRILSPLVLIQTLLELLFILHQQRGTLYHVGVRVLAVNATCILLFIGTNQLWPLVVGELVAVILLVPKWNKEILYA